MDKPVITVFGGSGFLGRHLINRLARGGALIRVAVPDPIKAEFLKIDGDPGQITPWPADVSNPDSVAAAVEGAQQVINLVGILYERGKRTFRAVHIDGAGFVARAAHDAGVAKLVHVSAIGADPDSPGRYGQSKAQGEDRVQEAFPDAVIIRPSVIFGPEDKFFNLFAGLSRLMPFLPVFGCPPMPRVTLFPEGGFADIDLYGNGGTRFQPVYVGDVADAIAAILADGSIKGTTFELGGPTQYSFKEIMELLLAQIGRKKFLAPVPFALARFEAWFLEKWPVPILTRDQVDMLRRDNVCSGEFPGFEALAIKPVAAEAILPGYLHRFRPPSRQGQGKASMDAV